MDPFITLMWRLQSDNTGAVTTDWVTLTSLLVLPGMATGFSIFNNGVSSLMVGVNTLTVSAAGIDVFRVPAVNGGG